MDPAGTLLGTVEVVLTEREPLEVLRTSRGPGLSETDGVEMTSRGRFGGGTSTTVVADCSLAGSAVLTGSCSGDFSVAVAGFDCSSKYLSGTSSLSKSSSEVASI